MIQRNWMRGAWKRWRNEMSRARRIKIWTAFLAMIAMAGTWLLAIMAGTSERNAESLSLVSMFIGLMIYCTIEQKYKQS
jgi:hypothetical protein